MARSDLESAMGAVLTSRSARNMILDDPDGFAAYFSLSTSEAAALAGMAGDLAALMPTFVSKREAGLRRPFGVALSLLAETGAILVEDYSDAYAPPGSAVADAVRFADFLVEKVPEFAAQMQYGDVILDVVRFEQMRLQCAGTERPLHPVPEKDPLDPRRIDPGRFLWVRCSTAVRSFGWDVRTVHSRRDLPRLRPDPTHLLCAQRDDDGEVVVLRVDGQVSQIVGQIAARPGEISAAEVGELLGSNRSLEALLGKFVAQGIIRGTAP